MICDIIQFMKRVFIAINLSDQIKEKLCDYQKQIQDLFTLHRTEGSGAGPCRWLKKQTLHITLGFLGNRNEKELEKIFKAVKRVGERHKPFLILLNKICYGPGKMMPPRLVWAKGQKSESFSKLKQDLDFSLKEEINFKPEKRELTPHITLARIKKWDWQRLDPEQRPEINLLISIEIPVNSIEIMESKLKRTGAEYKTLFSAELKTENF